MQAGFVSFAVVCGFRFAALGLKGFKFRESFGALAINASFLDVQVSELLLIGDVRLEFVLGS